jgi:hypothetical protein
MSQPASVKCINRKRISATLTKESKRGKLELTTNVIKNQHEHSQSELSTSDTETDSDTRTSISDTESDGDTSNRYMAALDESDTEGQTRADWETSDTSSDFTSSEDDPEDRVKSWFSEDESSIDPNWEISVRGDVTAQPTLTTHEESSCLSESTTNLPPSRHCTGATAPATINAGPYSSSEFVVQVLKLIEMELWYDEITCPVCSLVAPLVSVCYGCYRIWCSKDCGATPCACEPGTTTDRNRSTYTQQYP